MIIDESFVLDIDKQNDGLGFSFTMFNQKNYDKDLLRSVVVNTGVHLKISNEVVPDFTLRSVSFAIIRDGAIIVLLSSREVEGMFPRKLEIGTSLSLFFYAAELAQNFRLYEDEDIAVIINLKDKQSRYDSEQFSGDVFEHIVEHLEDGDHANWMSQGLHRLDVTHQMMHD